MANGIKQVIELGRGISQIPEAVRQQGGAGIFQALSQPQTFERSQRFDQMRRAAPELAGEVEAGLTALEQGDPSAFDNTSTSIFRMNQALVQRGLPEKEVKDFTGANMQRLIASTKPETLQGASNLTRVGAAGDPSGGRAMAAGTAGVELPARAMAPQAAAADLERTQATTRSINYQTENVMPAQVEQYQANADYDRAKAANPGAYRSGGASPENTFSQIVARNTSALSRQDAIVQKALKQANDLGTPEAVTAALEQRNAAARALKMPDGTTMPQLKLRTMLDPNYDPKKPLAEQQMYVLELAGDDEGQQQGGAAPAQQQRAPMGGGGGGARQPPVQAEQFDPNQGLPQGGARQKQPFQAAVQNPLSLLSDATRSQLATPAAQVKASTLMQEFTSQGYSEDEARQLLGALIAQQAAE